MSSGMTYEQILWFFLIYSFIGWVLEVTFHAVVVGKVINRGFLNGPLCPVYGFGMLTVLSMVNYGQRMNVLKLGGRIPDGRSVLIIFFGGMLLATAIELIAGWLLDVIFHMRWWDYSDKPFHFHGYICLGFSILWGIGTVLVLYIVQPLIEAQVERIPDGKFSWILLGILYLILAADIVVTVSVIIGLNKRLAELDRIRNAMLAVSDALTNTIAENSIKTVQKIEEGQEQAIQAGEKLKSAATEKYEETAQMLGQGKEELRQRYEKTAQMLGQGKEELRQRYEETTQKLGQGKEELRQRYAEAAEKLGRSREELLLRKQELERRYEALRLQLSKHSIFSPGRILRSVPELMHRDYMETLRTLIGKLQDNE